MHSKWAILVLFFLAVAARSADDYEPRVYKDAGGKELPYQILKPKNYDAKIKYPLVLLLHGAGERGNDNKKQLAHGAKTFSSPANMDKYPCFVIAPQCPNNVKWVEVDWGGLAHTTPVEPSAPLRMAGELVAAMQKEFSIDAKRLYVCGLSMGGFGTWDILSRSPDTFAAAMPICGGADEAKAPLIAKIPLLIYHGGNDTVVKTIRSRNIVEALKKAGGDPKYVELPGVGHDAWSKAFSDPASLEWMFAQKK